MRLVVPVEENYAFLPNELKGVVYKSNIRIIKPFLNYPVNVCSLLYVDLYVKCLKEIKILLNIQNKLNVIKRIF